MKEKAEKEKKLNKREKEILLFLYKFRVAEIKTIQVAVDYKNYVNAKNTLKSMYERKYLIRYRTDIYDPYEYALSYKGLRYFGTNGFEYNFFSQQKNNHLLHSKLVSFFLRDNKEIKLNDLKSQRELLSYYYKVYEGFHHYKLPVFIYENEHIFFDLMTSQSYDVNSYVLKLNDVIHYQNPNEFIVFDNVFNPEEQTEISNLISKPIYFHSIDDIKSDNNFALKKLRSD